MVEAKFKLPNDVLRDWWISKARLGMSPNEAVLSMRDALAAAGFMIVRDRSDQEGGIPGRN